ncbi:alpha/beta-hydrolase [Laetiporus sulphureus 93-53]|uniref:Alpha/beta-hydrolase n=1 Tax=Laetiporus sulphureus 93-53 TaxID=1314785 RepID=A0A165D2N4_9APHY|nr:alpha/beta-hydrolase [Laetiporus sulphureus 93-53]KZT04036.1 alpha/beta-hydrolase [Laetiporus sulphureus 93-53]
MDAIAAQQERSVPLIYDYTRNAFLPYLEAHRAEIEAIERTTFKYGVTDRHQLDVYYPSEVTQEKAPVLFFIYGGGFVTGERIFPPPFDLVYRNLGAFFAKRGILTIIPDYRLVPSVMFPEPVKDIRDAIAWVLANTEEVGRRGTVHANFDNVMIMGHSAGSIYTATMMLYPGLLPLDVRSHIRGVILAGGIYRFSRESATADPAGLEGLYGSWEEVQNKMPATLPQRAPGEIVDGFPEVLMMASEREPDGVFEESEEFAAALGRKLGRKIGVSTMKKHNHLSPHLSLWSGSGEEWAIEVEQWVKSRVASK